MNEYDILEAKFSEALGPKLSEAWDEGFAREIELAALVRIADALTILAITTNMEVQ